MITITSTNGQSARYAYGAAALGVMGVGNPQLGNVIDCGSFSTTNPVSVEGFEGQARFSNVVAVGRYPFDIQLNEQVVRVTLPPTVLSLHMPSTGRLQIIR